MKPGRRTLAAIMLGYFSGYAGATRGLRAWKGKRTIANTQTREKARRLRQAAKIQDRRSEETARRVRWGIAA